MTAKPLPALAFLGCAFMATACATSIDTAREGIAAAPEWFEQTRSELSGADYPDISRVPDNIEARSTRARLTGEQTSIQAQEAQMLALLASHDTLPSLADVERERRQMQALTNAAPAPAQQLSESEKAEIVALFEARAAN